VLLNSGGHLEPGANNIESLWVGLMTLAAGSVLDFELSTIAGVNTSDLVNVTGASGLSINGGTLNLTDVGGMTGGIYTLIDYNGAFNGSLSNITIGATPVGFTYRLFDNPADTTIRLEVTAPGDFNHDGAVDGADYVVWRKGVGTKYTPSDYDSWRTHFGQTYTPGSGTGVSAVPEPRAWVSLLVGAVLLVVGWRWRVLLPPRWG
jgi:hypothetical protein